MFGKKDDKGAKKRGFWPWGKSDDKAPTPQPGADAQLNAEATVEPSTTTPTDSSPEPVENSDSATDSQPEVLAESLTPATTSELAQSPELTKSEMTSESTSQCASDVKLEQEAADSGFFSRIKTGLNKTRDSLLKGVSTLFIGKKEIDDELLEELEAELIMADVGVDATSDIMAGLTERVKYKELDNFNALMVALKVELTKILEPSDKPLVIDQRFNPYVILVVGVNGAGKTTTIGKLAKRLKNEGRKVMLAAGDTFRAAAVEQLQAWGDRNQISVTAQQTGSDSASVIYDALESAKARGADVLIADTAGRLHNKEHLMEELKKVKRVLGKLDKTAPHEVLLVMDAGTGQNALNQAKLFNETVQVTGMALTKLDGTAKGGVVFALARQMQLPIRFLGMGEQIDDLRPFRAAEFVDALFSDTEFQ
ncbi:MAG: signal recognition particle-docking protein FtsY [Endozoicomonadaceae bacterium]|nr:signal recognition particle-docking protein FtsY [Endozoicomonadaceae bacterium]